MKKFKKQKKKFFFIVFFFSRNKRCVQKRKFQKILIENGNSALGKKAIENKSGLFF